MKHRRRLKKLLYIVCAVCAVCMETIAVTSEQSAALLREAKKRAKKTKVEGCYKAYFKRVRGRVPSVTDNKTSCAGHRLVRVVCGLRKCAGIVHKSRGNVHFAPRTKLARKHPRGLACFMKNFISDHHHDMEQRTRTAPVLPDGYDMMFAQRRFRIIQGSHAQLREERDGLQPQIRQLDFMIARGGANAGNYAQTRAAVMARIVEINDLLGYN